MTGAAVQESLLGVKSQRTGDQKIDGRLERVVCRLLLDPNSADFSEASFLTATSLFELIGCLDIPMYQSTDRPTPDLSALGNLVGFGLPVTWEQFGQAQKPLHLRVETAGPLGSTVQADSVAIRVF